jgi:hypothetical protein
LPIALVYQTITTIAKHKFSYYYTLFLKNTFKELSMGFRFRKSVKILPGVRLNLSKKGTSVSLGGRGATVNVSKKGTTTTVGLPGSGLSYSKYSPHSRNGSNSGIGIISWLGLIIFGILILAALN